MTRGDWYAHTESGAMYRIVAVTNQAATRPNWPVTVVYRDRGGNIWSRPIDDFLDRCRFVAACHRCHTEIDGYEGGNTAERAAHLLALALERSNRIIQELIEANK